MLKSNYSRSWALLSECIDTCYFFLVRYRYAKQYSHDEIREKKLYGRFIVINDSNGIVDRNFALQRAYGQIYDPDYTCSADMISYLEVDQDIFQLQKYGLNPNTDVNFYFDSIDFACALATKLG